MSLHREHDQHPLTITCECFDQMLFKPNMLKQTFFYSICPIDDRLKCLDCNECASLYTFSNVDKIVAVIVMSVHF